MEKMRGICGAKWPKIDTFEWDLLKFIAFLNPSRS